MSPEQRTILQDSSLTYWRLGEMSGTTAVDVQGLASGTLSGSYSLGSAGPIVNDNDSAVFFTGGRVVIPDVAALNIVVGQITLECWMRTVNPAFQHAIGAYNYPTSTNGYGLATGVSGTGKVGYWSGGGNGNSWFEGATNIADNRWHHVAVSCTSSLTILMVDGVVDASKVDDLRPLTGYRGTRCLADRADAVGVAAWSGGLKDVAIYNVALSQSRLLAHYRAGIQNGVFASPIGNCPFIKGRAA
jgi:hypothetical protein